MNFVETTLADIRYSIRTLLRRPGFAALAILTLATGIAANTAMFSVLYTVLLRPLSYPEPDQLVAIFERRPREGVMRNVVAPGDLLGGATRRGRSPRWRRWSISASPTSATTGRSAYVQR